MDYPQPDTGDETMDRALGQLSDKDKMELNQLVNNESQKLKIQNTIHVFTSRCFDKCITSRITSGQLDKSEETCLRNCVNRFLDTNFAVLKHLERLRTSDSV